MNPPKIENSTKEEREKYINHKYGCKNNCEICGMCKVLKGKSPEIVFAEYIEGIKDIKDISI